MCSRKDRRYVRSPDKKKLLNFTFEKFNTEFSSRALGVVQNAIRNVISVKII